ncbi:MAG: ABC transporter substrate-binding protein [Stellaceae bacterium]
MKKALMVGLLSCATAMAAVSARADTVKIGVLTSFSGMSAIDGNETDAVIKMFVDKYGDTIGGHKLEFIRRDTTGPNPATAKPRAQDLIFRQKVQIINGLDFTPNVLAIAPLVTAGKVPTIITGAATSGTVAAKSPYYLRTFMTLGQVSRPMADWAFKHGIKKVFTMVADYAPGYEAEKAFNSEFKKDGGTIVGSLRAPLHNPEFSSYMQRVKDAHPQALFGFMPIGDVSIALVHAFDSSGLKQAGIKLIGTGDIVDESTLPADGNAALGIVTAFPYTPGHKSRANNAFRAAYENVTHGKVPLGMSAITFWDGMQLIRGALEAQKGEPFSAAKFMQYVAGRKLISPRGPIEIDPKTHDIIQNVYIRRVEMVKGKLTNVVIATIPHVMP